MIGEMLGGAALLLLGAAAVWLREHLQAREKVRLQQDREAVDAVVDTYPAIERLGPSRFEFGHTGDAKEIVERHFAAIDAALQADASLLRVALVHRDAGVRVLANDAPQALNEARSMTGLYVLEMWDTRPSDWRQLRDSADSAYQQAETTVRTLIERLRPE